jgi:hypothetical protein
MQLKGEEPMRIVQTQSRIRPKLSRVERKLARVPARAYRHFVEITPIRSGNARRRTKFVRGDTILADYPYAQRLDKGWSRQAPSGMVKPTIDFIRRLVQGIFGR